MTTNRISGQAGHATALQHAAESTRETSRPSERDTARSAVLYRGTTCFAYGPSPQAGNNAAKPRKFDALLRKRRAAARTRRNAADAAGEESASEPPALHDEYDLANGGHGSSGGSGGGHGSGGQQHQNEHDRPGISISKRACAPSAAPVNRLDTIAARFESSGDAHARAAAVRIAWRDAMLALRAQTADGAEGRTVRVVEQMLDLARVEARIGPVGAGGLAALRECAVAAKPSSAGRAFNLLLPLVWLRADLDASLARRQRALAALDAVRAGMLARTSPSERNDS